MSNSREQILLTTCDLLENQGFHATGLNEIVKESGAPKGSIYYYFPQGKDEIVSETIRFAGQRTAERIRSHLETISDPAEAIQSFLETIAYHVEASGFRAGGPITIVASESATTSERINQACQEAYTWLREAFAARLRAGGIETAAAESLAWTINATIEGAIILSRTFHTGNPLREAAVHLARLIRQFQ
ncbi:MAG: TetR/AcrR family transcriptional regulator [Chloroflexota bacterium]|jgi:TetR/AcrR family transcriptional repressor of lmrAB and yxaGH operons